MLCILNVDFKLEYQSKSDRKTFRVLFASAFCGAITADIMNARYIHQGEAR